jgi:hypothetical protein
MIFSLVALCAPLADLRELTLQNPSIQATRTRNVTGRPTTAGRHAVTAATTPADGTIGSTGVHVRWDELIQNGFTRIGS